MNYEDIISNVSGDIEREQILALEKFLINNGFEKVGESLNLMEFEIRTDDDFLYVSNEVRKQIYDLDRYMLIKYNSSKNRNDIHIVKGFNSFTTVSYLSGYDSQKYFAVVLCGNLFVKKGVK